MKIGDFEGFQGRSFPGRARASKEVDLAFRVSGPLMTLPVKVGDELKEGDLIARLDPRDFDVAVRNAEGNLQRAVATQRRAKDDYDRVFGLQKKNPGAISEAAVDHAREAVEVAKADIAAFEASVDAAKDSLSYTSLRAPFAGTIVATYFENFENVREKEMVVRLLDNSRIEFEVGLPETMISMASYVENILVRFDAFPDEEVPATVEEIGREASATTRTFPVTLIMDQPEGISILPGMAGRARGTLRQPDGLGQLTVVVPVTAIFSSGSEDKSFVWVIDESANSVSRREVQIGQLLNTGYKVEGGLEMGDVIATAGVNFLNEGQIVVPQIP